MLAVFVGFSAYADNCPGGVCGSAYGVSGAIVEGCTGKKAGDRCDAEGANVAECRLNWSEQDKQHNSPETAILSCTALECDEAHLLMLRRYGDSGYYSDGACRKIDIVKKQCNDECECGTCDIDIKNQNSEGVKAKFNGNAFFIDKPCHCVKEDKKTEKQNEKKTSSSDCYYKFTATVTCKQTGRTFKYGEQKKISQTELDQLRLSCDEVNSLLSDGFSEQKLDELLKKSDAITELFNKWCYASVSQQSDDENQEKLDVNAKIAKVKLDALFGGKRTVWRTEEGKFNTARLASDATAGVVLGTVGGIVSGKVIKKKQLEKGFDALQCTVGGQKMADYGDTFQVTFRR